jgi:sugar/nucleoside kinase (ribokinase family)
MMHQGVQESPAELVLRHALEKLRAHDGLTVPRVQGGAADVSAPLLALAAVRRYSSVHEVDLARAARSVVAESVRDGLNGSDQIVADAVLGLGVLADRYLRGGVDPRVVEDLRSGQLSRRRRILLSEWNRLHSALSMEATPAPSDRTLRGSMEAIVFAELARQLHRREQHSFGSSQAVSTRSTDPGEEATPDRRAGGRVIVVGGAVMDATFQTGSLPQRDTSSEAHSFHLSPGGKGLTQAIAAARLGLDVSLLAAVADDFFGHQILDYLQREHVDVSMIKVVGGGARTPFTGVIELELGDSIAVNWRNDREVRLDVRDIERHVPRLLQAQAVLVTFEIPRESMQRTLSLLSDSNVRRPVVIVTPSQPYVDNRVSAQALAQTDYLVAHAWELGRYSPATMGAFDLDVVARQLLAYGVETLCIPTGGGCTVYSETLGTFSVPTFPSAYKESAAARDAFCAALAARLIDGKGEFTEHVALWATAAMSAATADYPLPNSMPDRSRVEQFLSRSRFTVTPRPRADGLNDAAAGS